MVYARVKSVCLLLFVIVLAAGVPNLSGQALDLSSGSAVSLMPLPSTLSLSPGRLPLDSKFTVSIAKSTDGRLERAVDRMLQRLGERTGLILSPIARTKR